MWFCPLPCIWLVYFTEMSRGRVEMLCVSCSTPPSQPCNIKFNSKKWRSEIVKFVFWILSVSLRTVFNVTHMLQVSTEKNSWVYILLFGVFVFPCAYVVICVNDKLTGIAGSSHQELLSARWCLKFRPLSPPYFRYSSDFQAS